MSSFTYKSTTHAAVPRNGRLLDGRVYPTSASSSSWAGSGGSVAQYWQLVTQDADGNDLGEDNYYLQPVDDVSVISSRDVVAFANRPTPETGETDSLPVASYESMGILRVAQGTGLIIEDGVLSIDEGAIGSGLDETQLEEYLTLHKYLKEGDGLTLTSKLTGYAIGDSYPPLSVDDTILSAFGKLEKNFDRYVDTYSNQSVDGIKTFAQTIYSNQDVVGFATGTVTTTLPIASSSQLGIVKIGSNLSIDANGVLSANVQAGGLTSCTPYDSTSGFVNSIVYDSTSKALVYYRTTPKTLSWSYGSVTSETKGSYNALTATSFVIPSDTGHLSNGAGFFSVVGNNEYTSFASGTGNVVYAIGADTNTKGKLNYYYYTRRFFESQTLNTRIDLTSTDGNGGVKFYNKNGTRMKLGPGNGITGYSVDSNGDEQPGRVYINWSSDNDYVQFDESHNIAATGDIVAFATKSVVANTPIATTAQLGLVRVKSGGGIAIDSNGYLTCTVSGGSDGSSVSVKQVQTSGTKIATITVDGSGTDLYAPSVVSIKSVSQTTSNTGAGASNTVSVLNTNNVSIGTFTVYNGSQGPRGYGVGSVSAYSTSSDSGGSSVYYMYDTQNTYIGKFTVYNGAKGATGDLTLGSTVTSTITVKATSDYSSLWQDTDWTTQKWSHRNSYNGTYGWWNTNYRSGSYVCAEIGTDGSWNKKSDERTKNIKSYITNVLDDIEHINVIRYTLKNCNIIDEKIGIGALSVKNVFPEFTSKGEFDETYGDCLYSLDYATLGAVVAVAGLKELHALHKSLDTRVSTIEQWRITTDANKDALTKRVEALEQMINNKTE